MSLSSPLVEPYPPIIIPRWITRGFIQDNRHKLIFIYGDAYSVSAYQGQGAVACGEPNAYAVPTKYLACMDENKAFFDDRRFDMVWKPLIDKAIARIPLDPKRPIIPFPKIGLGRAMMKERCPKTYEYLAGEIEKLKYPNIKVDYTFK